VYRTESRYFVLGLGKKLPWRCVGDCSRLQLVLPNPTTLAIPATAGLVHCGISGPMSELTKKQVEWPYYVGNPCTSCMHSIAARPSSRRIGTVATRSRPRIGNAGTCTAMTRRTSRNRRQALSVCDRLFAQPAHEKRSDKLWLPAKERGLVRPLYRGAPAGRGSGKAYIRGAGALPINAERISESFAAHLRSNCCAIKLP
jgi:hypothetical protein